MRYIIGLLVTVGLIILIVVLLLSGHSSTPPAKTVDLRTYSTSATARAQLLVDGPVVSDQDHRSYEIDVTQNDVSMTVYKGYERTILRTKTYPNNANAFKSFMYGLQRSNFSVGDTSSKLGNQLGYCVDGYRYTYNLSNDNKGLVSFWSTTCNQGTFKGDSTTTIDLFHGQVPDYGDLVADQNF